MSGITSVITPLFNTLATGVVHGAVQSQFDRVTNQQQKAADQLQEQQTAQNATLQRNALLSQSEQDTAERTRKLRAGLARVRANFAAKGIDPDDGSTAALQAASWADVNQEQKFADADLSNRVTQIDQNLQNVQQRNLLQRSQLQQKQQLGYLRDTLF